MPAPGTSGVSKPTATIAVSYDGVSSSSIAQTTDLARQSLARINTTIGEIARLKRTLATAGKLSITISGATQTVTFSYDCVDTAKAEHEAFVGAIKGLVNANRNGKAAQDALPSC